MIASRAIPDTAFSKPMQYPLRAELARVLGKPLGLEKLSAASRSPRHSKGQFVPSLAAAASSPKVAVPNESDGKMRELTTDQSGPVPTVKIDNEHDAFSTIVCISYGDRLGEMLDTVAALKALSLNVRRAKVGINERGKFRHKFYITDSATSEKILRSRRLEEIRLTILNNLLLYHPESAEELNWGMQSRKSRSNTASPLGMRSHCVIETVIHVDGDEEEDQHSTLHIKTMDRPGLLVEIVKVLKDVNVNVISAEVDTEGKQVVDRFFVTYHGEPLNSSMVQLVTNALQYYLSLNEVEKEESY